MAKSVEAYLAKDFEETAAGYFASRRKEIVDVVANPDFSLTICFDNGERRLYDMRPLLKEHTVFAPLMREENFRRVYLDDAHCISWDIDPAVDSRKVWQNKIDLCPDTCYMDSKPL